MFQLRTHLYEREGEYLKQSVEQIEVWSLMYWYKTKWLIIWILLFKHNATLQSNRTISGSQWYSTTTVSANVAAKNTWPTGSDITTLNFWLELKLKDDHVKPQPLQHLSVTICSRKWKSPFIWLYVKV